MGHQSVVSLFAFAFLWLVWVGAPACAEGSESRQERGLEAVNPDTIMRIGEQGPDKKGPPIEVFVPPTISIGNAVISPDDRYLATTAGGGSLALWNVKTGQNINNFEAPTDSYIGEGEGYYWLQFDHEGRRIFWGHSYDPSIVVYSIDDDKPPVNYRLMSGGLRPLAPLALSEDDRYIFASNKGFLAIWDIQAGKIAKTIPFCEDKAIITLSSDQQYGLCAPSYNNYESTKLDSQGDNSLRLIELATGKEIRRFVGHKWPVTMAGFTADSSIIFSASHDGTVRIWDTATGNPIQVIKIAEPIIRYYPDNPLAKPKIDGGVTNAAISPDGQHIVATYSYTIGTREHSATGIWEQSTGKKIRQFDDIYGPFRFFRKGRHFYAVKNSEGGNYDGTLQDGVIVATQSGTLVRSFQKNPRSIIISVLGFITDRRKVLYTTEKSTVAFDIGTATLTQLLPVSASYLSGNGKFAFYLQGVSDNSINPDDSEIKVKVYDVEKIGIYSEIRLQSNRLVSQERGGKLINEPVKIKVISVSHDGSILITISSDGILSLWNTKSGEETRFTRPEWHRPGRLPELVGAVLSIDKSRLASIEEASKSMLRIWDVATGKELAAIPLSQEWLSLREPGSIVTFSPDNSRIIVSSGSHESEKIPAIYSVYSISTQKKDFSVQPPYHYDGAIQWSADSKKIIEAGWDAIVHIDAIKGEVSKTIAISKGDGFLGGVVSSDSKYVANSAGIWDAATGKPLVALAVFADGDDWLAITPEGYYSSSEKGHQYVNMRRGSAIYTADQLYDAFYRPDLVIDKLRGRDIQQAGGTTIEDALSNPPPSAEIVATTVQPSQGTTEIKYRIQGQGGGIGEVRLFHNQKLVRTVRVDAPGKDIHEGTAAIQAVAGENEVSLIAYNRQNSVQGITQTASFQFDAPPKDPDLYIVGIGIGQYRLKDVNLPLAAKDVLDITKALSARMKSLYQPPKVHVELLVDGITEGGVTREQILKRLRELAGTLHPSDQLVVFIASHGLLWNGQYYMVTHDYDGSFGPDQGISASEIMDASRDIKALNQLFIFDTCHAGGVDQTLKAIYDARIRLFARRMGLHVYASAAPMQEALEGYQGRGLFAYSLLEGLRHPKDVDQDGDGLVATTELGAYAKLITERVGQQIGFHQTPLIINVGQDKTIYRYPREASPTVALATSPADSGNRGAAPTTRAIELPTIQVGDRYTYESETLGNGQAAYQTLREVTAIDGDRVTVAVTPVKGGATRQTYYDRAWNFLGSGATPQEGVSFTPALRYLDFPLVVGKRWNATSIELNTKTQRQREFKVSGSVEGWERVDVPPGSFEAFKIVLKTEIVDGANRTFSTDVSWYAPSIRRTVKSELTGQEASSGTEEQKVVRLVSYQLR
ncbi:MAG: caspase family protein [Candidatus Competibacter sp.]